VIRRKLGASLLGQRECPQAVIVTNSNHDDDLRHILALDGYLRKLEVERVMGIEPTLEAWEAAVLPLNYTRSGVVPAKRDRQRGAIIASFLPGRLGHFNLLDPPPQIPVGTGL